MAKKAYIGVNGTARKVKKLYAGIENIARKVKKGYVGINGIARLFYSSVLQLMYYGTVTNLSMSLQYGSAASTGNHAIFGAGNKSSTTTCAYDGSLTRKSSPATGTARNRSAAAEVGGKAIFGGGETSSGSTSATDAYNDSLTKISVSSIHNAYNLAAASNGTRAVFAGGRRKTTDYDYVRSFDASLSMSSAVYLSQARTELKAAGTSSHIIFAGGNTGNYETIYSTTVDAINNSMTISTLSPLPYAISDFGGATNGTYAIFAGGINVSGSYYYNIASVFAYNPSLTRINLTSLSSARRYILGAEINGYTLFSGDEASNIKTVDIYDPNRTRIMSMNLSQNRNSWAAAAVAGKYLVYGGGISNTTAEAFILDYT